MKDRPATNKSQPSAKRRIPWLRKSLYAALVAMVVFGVPEIALRVAGIPRESGEPAVGTRRFVTWLSRLSVDPSRHHELYQNDPTLLWRLKPDVSFQTVNYHYAETGEAQSIQITINSSGYRGEQATPLADASIIRVLCMGDSNFFGYPLDDQHAFPAALQRTLSAGDPQTQVEVVNGGCPGYTVVQGWRWYQETFDEQNFNWMLLSYLNNDAWLQPRTDLAIMEKTDGALQPLARFARKSRIVRWIDSLRAVPRVSINTFEAYYRRFIDVAKQSGAQTLIVDFRAYDEYKPYSRALQLLAEQEQVKYISVESLFQERTDSPKILAEHDELVQRVQRRWGTEMIQQRPYLRYYAEYFPEHLNELGAALLSKSVADLMAE